MSKPKLFALIGAILATLARIYTTIRLPSVMNVDYVRSHLSSAARAQLTDSQVQMSVSIGRGIGIAGLIIGIIELIFIWIAYTRIDKKSERGWKIFLLIMGILACLGVLGVLGDPLGGILSLGEGVLFIMAFAIKGPQTYLEEDKY